MKALLAGEGKERDRDRLKGERRAGQGRGERRRGEVGLDGLYAMGLEGGGRHVEEDSVVCDDNGFLEGRR